MTEIFNALIEELAEIEHDQWWSWTKELEKIHRTDPAWQYIFEQWSKSWIPYCQLSEGQKDMDRVWARKVIEVFLKHMSLLKSKNAGLDKATT